MEEPLDETYFNWLCAKVLSLDVPIYFDLMRILYTTEFVWIHHRDRNRAEDGLELRLDFLRETSLEKDHIWYNAPCSVLEMLIAFSKTASFQTDEPVRNWFWRFMTNLELDEYRQVSNSDIPIIIDILHIFMLREYNEDGYGGLFPMRWPKHDQRELELWYQFSDYVEDQGLL